MIKVNFSGRSGNVLLQNVGASILSKKFNLKCEYKDVSKFYSLGLKLYDGGRIISEIVNQYDIDHSHVSPGPYGTLTNLLNRDSIELGLYYDGNFQVSEFVKDYKTEILEHFELKYDEEHSEDLFIHVRLGDVTQFNPGIEYYKTCISKIKVKKIYVSTDSPNHPIVQNLIDDYNAQLYNNNDEIETINFGKNFGNLILSKGTFSWWIGLLSEAKNILYPSGGKEWHGDIFIFENWTPISIN